MADLPVCRLCQCEPVSDALGNLYCESVDCALAFVDCYREEWLKLHGRELTGPEAALGLLTGRELSEAHDSAEAAGDGEAAKRCRDEIRRRCKEAAVPRLAWENVVVLRAFVDEYPEGQRGVCDAIRAALAALGEEV